MHRLSTFGVLVLLACGQPDTKTVIAGEPVRALWDSTQTSRQAGDTLRIKARIVDGALVPVTGRVIALTARLGGLSPFSVAAPTTDGAGYITVRWATPTLASAYTIEAQTAQGSPLGSITVTVTAAPAVAIAHAPGPYTLLVGQQRTADQAVTDLSIVGIDRYGNATDTPGEVFSFSPSGAVAISGANISATTRGAGNMAVSYRGSLANGAFNVPTQVVTDAAGQWQIGYLCQRNATAQQDSLRVNAVSSDMRYVRAVPFPSAVPVTLTGHLSGALQVFAAGRVVSSTPIAGTISADQSWNTFAVTTDVGSGIPASVTFARLTTGIFAATFSASDTFSPCNAQWQIGGLVSMTAPP